MRFSVYKISTGEILSTGYCPDEDVIHQAKDDEEVLLYEVELGKYYVENNELVEIPTKPNIYSIFDYIKKQWIDPRTPETQWPIVRQQRDLLLQQSDYTQLLDVPLDNKSEWATYRQELRDVTNQSDPFNIVWPVPPA